MWRAATSMRKGLSAIALGILLSGLPLWVVPPEHAWGQTIQDRTTEADNLNQLGIQQYGKGQLKEALATFQQVLVIRKQMKDRAGEGTALNNIGAVYNSLGQYSQALEYYQQSLVIRKESSAIACTPNAKSASCIAARTGEEATLNNIGLIYSRLGQSSKALAYYQQALAIIKEVGDRDGEGVTLNNIGAVYRGLGQYSKALEYYRQSLAIIKEIGVSACTLNSKSEACSEARDGEGRTLNNIGLVYDNLGQYSKALEYYRQSLAIIKEIGDRYKEGLTLNNIGTIYDYLGQYPKALEIYQQALAIQKEIGDRAGAGTTLNNIGAVYRNLGQYPKALAYYQQSLTIIKEIGDRPEEGRTLNNIGLVYDNLGQYSKALEYYQQSLAIQKETGDRFGEGKNLSNIGWIYSRLEQYPKALEMYQQSFALQKEIGDRAGVGITLSNIAYALNAQSKTELAILFFKQSVSIRESIRKDLQQLSREEQQSFTLTIADTYRSLADLLLKQGRVTEALQVLDLLKVQELEDYLKNVKGNDRTAQGIQLLEPEKAISGQILALSSDSIPEINRQLANQIQQLPKAEINKVPDYLQKLPQGAVLIYPLILSDRLELIVFSPNTLPSKHTVPIKKADFEKLVTDFRSDLRDFTSIDVKTSGKKLYDVLIKPIESDLKQAKATTILYAPDGILRYIPLGALYDGTQWLVENYRVNNLIAYSLFEPDRKPQVNLRIFAGAFGGKGGETRFGFGGLPSTIPEVDNIQSIFPNATKLIGQDFTAQSSKNKVSGNTIIHFATHAQFKSVSPLDSYVLFGDGSKVTLSEINEWQLKDADLVVLSACETGVGSLGNGAEILGFGYQVQRAGAKASIASLWTVSDGGTQLLMESFYGNLQKGDLSISTSLREAQLSMIRRPIKTGEVNYNHPYYWSAFVLIGNGL
ncbi:tetratricopeptide repeat protein [Tumidithrix elongata RA019]|uniref:Tetratricopeptide repeat protein n=1 Tax=Tumidithrix elongata BACA0141 TaxID=2716417 RepID=A0AAW9Q8D9_9CYAN|nr:tetratricopeptide repeat protein [Tumidithrix elongata RA019]